MSEPSSQSTTSAQHAAERVLTDIAARPYSFDFFQAVRLLMRIARSTSAGPLESGPVGHDIAPQREIVRFRALPSHSFPQAEIASFTLPTPDGRGGSNPAEMTVSFLGLTGPAGAMPHHYTQTVIDRIRLKDGTLQDFLDLFNHRAISFFYRAWEKHRAPALLERAQGERREDPFTRALYCLAGLGAPALRNRLEFADETFIYYSGLFSHYPKNAISLERMLGEVMGLPVSILQLQGQWLALEPSEQTSMPSARRPAGLNCALGVSAIAGERVWSIESKFRIRLGPIGIEAFQALLPGGRLLTQLAQIARTYAGPEYDFDAQLVLRREETPFCKLGAGERPGPRLGWNTWACSVVRSRDAEEAVFAADGAPSR
jgi:type VI secretion system protein ImpH